jgi:hypothetical protein
MIKVPETVIKKKPELRKGLGEDVKGTKCNEKIIKKQ